MRRFPPRPDLPLALIAIGTFLLAGAAGAHQGQTLVRLSWPFVEQEVGANGWHETVGSRFHQGTDHHAEDWNFRSGSADLGRPVLSASAGMVVRRGDHGSCYGNEVVVRLGDQGRQLYVRYAHLQSIAPEAAFGRTVALGSRIGTVGESGEGRKLRSGASCGFWTPHLHVSLYGRFPPRVTTDGLPFEFVQGRPSVYLADASISPARAKPGASVDFVYRVGNPTDARVTLRLGASIRPAGSSAWTDDPARDKLVIVAPGTANVSRRFLLPRKLSPGLYDVAWTLVEERSKAWLARREDVRLLVNLPPTQGGPSVPPHLSESSRLRPDGIGPIRLGMTVAEARRAAGVPLKEIDGPACHVLFPTTQQSPWQGIPGVALHVSPRRRVYVVEVNGRRISTRLGLRIGNSKETVLRRYRRVTNHGGAANAGGSVLVYRWSAAGSRIYFLGFATDGRRITAMRSAQTLPDVLADEYCG